MSAQLVQDALGLLSGSMVGFSLGSVGGGGSIFAVTVWLERNKVKIPVI